MPDSDTILDTLKGDDKILHTARERLRWAEADSEDNRRMAYEALEFIAVENAQWPEEIRRKRESSGRPCATVNKMPTFIDQVVGDQRMNRPSIKVIPVDSKADKEVARILSGWIKHVEQISKSDVAIDHAFEHAVACGHGALRVVTKYSSDSSFDQDAYIQKVPNALAIWWGPHEEYDCSDAPWCFVVSDMDKDEFKKEYDDDAMPFPKGDTRYIDGWSTDKTVRVAEYYVKEPVKKTLYLLMDGRVVDKLEEGDEVKSQREVKTYKVMWYLLTANKIVDRKEWPGKKYIPIIPVWGKEINVGGKRYIRGLIHNAKDPQRLYNYWISLQTEMVALSPKAPYILTAKQINGYENLWDSANEEAHPYLLINTDPEAPPPHREAPPQVSSAMTEGRMTADQDIRDTMGLQRASLGMQSNERSGAAIRERKQEGDVGTFAFHGQPGSLRGACRKGAGGRGSDDPGH